MRKATYYKYDYRLTRFKDLLNGTRIEGRADYRRAVKRAMRDNVKADGYAHVPRNELNPRLRAPARAVDVLRVKIERRVLGRELGACARTVDIDGALALIVFDSNHADLLHGTGYDVIEKMFPQIRFFSCIDCSHVGRWNERVRRMDDEPLCQDCADNEYYYNPDFDRYQDYEYRAQTSIIGEYHSSKYKVQRIPSKYDSRKPRVLLGLELEMECIDREDTANELNGRLGNAVGVDGNEYDYAFFERDNSLDNGVEMVTAWTGLDVHETMIKRGFDRSLVGTKSHNTKTCGLHVHVCKSTMTTLHASKLILFINDARNAPFITALARRDNASYAKFSDKQKQFKDWARPLIDTTKQGYRGNALRRLNSDRYEAVNFQGENTIEFRLFKGTLVVDTILACLEFSFLAWHFTKDASVADLTEKAFCEFISRDAWRSDSRYLRKYLHGKGFKVAYKAPVSAPVVAVV
jgi:hypothetical protein